MIRRTACRVLMPRQAPVLLSPRIHPSSTSCPSASSRSLAKAWQSFATRWSSGEATAFRSADLDAAAGAENSFTARLRRALHNQGPTAAVKQALAELGRYRGNEVAWQNVMDLLCESGDSQSLMHIRALSMEELLELVRVLTLDVELTQASFWEKLTEGSKVVFEGRNTSMEDIVELAGLYTMIGTWQKAVFRAALVKITQEVAVHWLAPSDLSKLLAIFGRAGSASRELSGLATKLFNELEDRVLEDCEKFELEDCISVIDSMARFSTRDNEVVLRHIGRTKLHDSLLELTGLQIAEVCHSYGSLGWRHDTVFKQVMTAILSEQERSQQARVLGLALDSPMKFSGAEIALVAMALIRLRMYRGNNDWYRWGENYKDLLDVLVRRLEAHGDLQRLSAKPLAAAAYVLGRDRRGTQELCIALLARMREVLQDGQVWHYNKEGQKTFFEAPQRELERFMHGMAMMGPTKRKEYLDTQWLREWMCLNYYTLSLPDLILINRHMVAIRCVDKPYLETFIPLFCEPHNIDQLGKSDIIELCNTYNGAQMRVEETGKHFWWALGRQFQKKQVQGLSMGESRKRPKLQRIG